MKVLVLSHSSGAENMGGAELSLLQVIDQWAAAHPSTEFLVVARAPNGQLQPELDARGVPHRTIPFDSWVLPLVRRDSSHVILTNLMDGSAVAEIRRLIREFEAEIVVTNTIVSPWAAFAAKFEGLPHVWFVHEYGDLDHGLGFRIGRDETFTDIELMSELVVANSEAIRDHLQQWIPAHKLAIAYPPITPEPPASDDLLSPSAPPDSTSSAVTVDLSAVMVGRITRSKGQWRLVEAIDRLRREGLNISATLVGFSDSDDGRALAKEVDARGLAGLVTLAGEHGDPAPFVAAADVAVMASDSEAFGRVTVEYMAAGKPVIAANTGANLELVVEGESGWLFDRDSIDSLCDAIRAAAHDSAERLRRGLAARERVYSQVLKKYPLQTVIGRIREVAHRGALPMHRLPAFASELLEFPRFVDQYASERSQLRAEVTGSRTWRFGTGVVKAARPALPVARAVLKTLRRARGRGATTQEPGEATHE